MLSNPRVMRNMGYAWSGCKARSRTHCRRLSRAERALAVAAAGGCYIPIHCMRRGEEETKWRCRSLPIPIPLYTRFVKEDSMTFSTSCSCGRDAKAALPTGFVRPKLDSIPSRARSRQLLPRLRRGKLKVVEGKSRASCFSPAGRPGRQAALPPRSYA